MHRTHKNICKSKKQKESDAGATLVASYCRKLISSNPCMGMECKEPIKLFISSMNKKKCCHGNTCCHVLSKNWSALIHAGVWNAKNPQKYLYIGKRNRKCCHGNTCCQVLSKNLSAPICAGAWNAKKNPQKYLYIGRSNRKSVAMECQEPTKRF